MPTFGEIPMYHRGLAAVAAATALAVCVHACHQVSEQVERRKNDAEQHSPLHPHTLGVNVNVAAKTADDPTDDVRTYFGRF